MVKPTYTIAMAAVLMVAAFAGIAMVDDEADAASGNVMFQVGSITYTATSDENGSIVLPTPGEGILANESAQYFQGWRESTVEDGPVYSAGSTQTEAIGKTFVAVYIEYSVSFFENTAQTADAPVKGTALKLDAGYDASATPGGTIVLPDADDFTTGPAAGEGLQFIGWSINGVFYEPGATYTITADAEAIAVYNDGFKVTFSNDSGVINTITVLGELTASQIPVPSQTGYAFAGWDINDDGKVDITAAQVSAEGFKYTVTADMDFMAVFTANNVTVTLMNGEAVVGKVTVLYNEKLVKPDIEDGYYWAIQTKAPVYGEDGTTIVEPAEHEEFDFSTPITGDMTLYAIAGDLPTPDENVYVTFNIEGKEPYTYIVSDRLTVPSTNREGYNFLGWTIQGQDVAMMSTEKVQSDIRTGVYTEDTTFVAVYEVAEPPAPEEPAFYETTTGQVAIIIVVFVLLLFGYAVYSNMGGLKDKLFGYTISKKEKKE